MYFSSVKALVDEIGWENHVNRQIYLGESTATAGGSCNADGTVKNPSTSSGGT